MDPPQTFLPATQALEALYSKHNRLSSRKLDDEGQGGGGHPKKKRRAAAAAAYDFSGFYRAATKIGVSDTPTADADDFPTIEWCSDDDDEQQNEVVSSSPPPVVFKPEQELLLLDDHHRQQQEERTQRGSSSNKRRKRSHHEGKQAHHHHLMRSLALPMDLVVLGTSEDRFMQGRRRHDGANNNSTSWSCLEEDPMLIKVNPFQPLRLVGLDGILSCCSSAKQQRLSPPAPSSSSTASLSTGSTTTTSSTDEKKLRYNCTCTNCLLEKLRCDDAKKEKTPCCT